MIQGRWSSRVLFDFHPRGTYERYCSRLEIGNLYWRIIVSNVLPSNELNRAGEVPSALQLRENRSLGVAYTLKPCVN